jgi:hypothetical protein
MSGIILGKKVDTVLIHADALFLCVNGKGAVQALRHPEFELSGEFREIRLIRRDRDFKTIL